MIEKDDQIKRLFNEKLKGFEAKVPDAMWNRIEASLAQESEVIFAKKRSTRRVSIMRWSAATISVAAMLTLLLLLFNIEQTQDIPLAQIVETETNQHPQAVLNEDKSSSAMPKLYTEHISTVAQSEKRKVDADNKDGAELNDKVVDIQSSDEIVEIEQQTKDVREEVESDDIQKQNSKKEREEAKVQYEKELIERANNRVYGSKASSDKKTGLSLGLNSRSNFALLNTVETAQADGTMLLPQLYTKKQEVEFRHYQPIAVGISISKEIFRDVRAEIGVSYIYAMSRVKSNPDGEFDIDDRQVFHYLALPVSLSYRFAEVKKFKFQASVGGSVQKDVYGLHKGKVPTQEGMKNPLPDDEMTKIGELEQDNPQFSINTTLGVAYPIYKKMNIYTSVGWAYYFDAKNKYKTIYSDRPHQLDLNLGLRFDF